MRSGAAICVMLGAAPGVASADEFASQAPGAFSPWDMFLSADDFVKAVMVLLALASIATWTVAIAKAAELARIGRRLDIETRLLERAMSLEGVIVSWKDHDGLTTALFEARAEAEVSGRLPIAGVKERIASRLERAEAQFGRRLARATGIVATTGSAAPFVGLFGTVWGIMNSFVRISRQHTTNLAVVAPGIAEALLATALGLAAAIPAVVFYNMLARSIAARRARYADGAAAIFRLASRDLDCRPAD